MAIQVRGYIAAGTLTTRGMLQGQKYAKSTVRFQVNKRALGDGVNIVGPLGSWECDSMHGGPGCVGI